jgi:hypothetical protein|tara:strand:+ start:179 stop:400 length:222 start_codon:yes stop_codon:yes gene_type:complete
MKTISLKVRGTTQSQWSTFVLELNLMKKAWKRYGVEVELVAPNLGKIIKLGTSHGEKTINYKKKPNHILNIFS